MYTFVNFELQVRNIIESLCLASATSTVICITKYLNTFPTDPQFTLRRQ